jgi:hypothetical protein
MKNLLAAVLVGILLFVGSAGASWFLIYMPMQAEAEAQAAAEAEALAEDEANAAAVPPPVPKTKKVEAMPVAVRPETPVTVEAVTELAHSVMQKERALVESRERLAKEEKRINLLFEDLKRERDELTAFGQLIESKIAKAAEVTDKLKVERQKLVDQTNTLSSLEKKTGKTPADAESSELDSRVDVVKSWFKNLDPEQAANYLKEFANRGDLQFSARLLDSLGDRQIAKILAAFNDPPLVAQIVDAYTKNKNEN